MKNERKKGTKIISVKIGDKEYPTYIDTQGTQRFFENSVIGHLFETRQIDLNTLARDYSNGKFSKLDYAEFNMMLGYSVSGWCELHNFQDMPVHNPLWDEKGRKKR